MISKETLYHWIPREKREWNKRAAKWLNYFWLPCPICGEEFAGFEWIYGHSIYYGATGTGVCCKPECKKEARKQSRFFAYCFDNNGNKQLAFDPASDPKMVSTGEIGDVGELFTWKN